MGFNSTDLDVRKTPNNYKKHRKRTTGKKFKLGLCEFLYHLFLTNERAPRRKKMTDAEIIRQVCIEYRYVPAVYNIWKRNDLRLVYVKRSEYNRGVLTTNDPPPAEELTSFSYDENGDPINPRYSPPKKLSYDQVKAMRKKTTEKYRKKWERDNEASNKS